jgi:hypothetical protein
MRWRRPNSLPELVARYCLAGAAVHVVFPFVVDRLQLQRER